MNRCGIDRFKEARLLHFGAREVGGGGGGKRVGGRGEGKGWGAGGGKGLEG